MTDKEKIEQLSNAIFSMLHCLKKCQKNNEVLEMSKEIDGRTFTVTFHEANLVD